MTRGMMCSALMLVALSPSACGERARLGSGCEWPDEPGVSIDSKNPAQQRHLRDDAEAAETRALRYADQQEALGSNRRRTREQCEAALWDSIARVHQVTPDQVRQALRRQNDTPF